MVLNRKNLPLSWIFRMAARDGRKSWRRLLFYVSATSLGIGGLVAAGSLQHNLQEALRHHAKPLVGADLVVHNRRPYDRSAEDFFAELSFPRLREVELNTVVFFPRQAGSRLMELRAIQPGFPFYGEVRTEPPQALEKIFAEPAVLIEENVATEFALAAGDMVELGHAQFRIAGVLKMVPGQAVASLFSAPQIFIAQKNLEKTGLIREESLARHKIYFKIENAAELEKTLALLKPEAERRNWRLNTVADRQRSLGRRAENATRFLKLAALIALILGGLGVATILFVYARDKWEMAATLKCLGAPSWPVLGIFVLQGVGLGAAGTVLGVVLGLLLQAGFPVLLSHFILVEIPFFISWRSLLGGAVMGFSLTFLFSLLPLISLRSISPLAALRMNDGPQNNSLRDRLAWEIGALTLLLMFVFAKTQTGRVWLAAGVPASLVVVLVVFSLLTRFLLREIRSRMPDSWPYSWRQGLANLFRPQNQTHVLVSALGTGSALIFTIAFLNSSLLNHIELSTTGQEPNLALIDIQRYQRDEIRQAVGREGAAIIDEVPFVSMRIEEIKGDTRRPSYEGGGRSEPGWARRREYRSTYRNHLGVGEKIVAGQWPPPLFKEGDTVPVSMEEGIAEDLGLALGDKLVFNVQGISIPAVVAALREVDWFQLRPNFFIIFPENVLEQAPQFTVMMVRAPSVEKTAAVQRTVRNVFPNISTVDLRLILETLRGYFDKVAMALKFMGLFVVGTGLMILAGALISGRYQRLREAALLRTLGASRDIIRRIHVIEYGLIGLFAGLAGLLLGGCGSFLTAKYIFDIAFRPGALPVLGGLAGMVGISVVTGLFLGRGLLRHPPLETFREDG